MEISIEIKQLQQQQSKISLSSTYYGINLV